MEDKRKARNILVGEAHKRSTLAKFLRFLQYSEISVRPDILMLYITNFPTG
jgi:hypothetical protein